jgi:hypothetical protein
MSAAELLRRPPPGQHQVQQDADNADAADGELTDGDELKNEGAEPGGEKGDVGV